MLQLGKYPELFFLLFHHDSAGGVNIFQQEIRLSALVCRTQIFVSGICWTRRFSGKLFQRSFRLALLVLLSGSMQWLAERQCVCSHAEIYCCGLLSTRKSDCTGLPPSMLNNSATPQSRGQYRIRMKGNMSLICWYNKGHFRFLTNAYSPVQQGKQYSYFSSQKCTCFMSQARVSH